jgi:uncharacterized membrane protein YqjE
MQPLPPQREKVSTLLQVAQNLLALAQLRASLFAVELAEEVENTKQLLSVALAAAVFTALGLMFAGLCIVVMCWDNYRLQATLGVTLAYLAIGAALLFRARKLAEFLGAGFAETRRELTDDLKLFVGSDDHK